MSSKRRIPILLVIARRKRYWPGAFGCGKNQLIPCLFKLDHRPGEVITTEGQLIVFEEIIQEPHLISIVGEDLVEFVKFGFTVMRETIQWVSLFYPFRFYVPFVEKFTHINEKELVLKYFNIR